MQVAYIKELMKKEGNSKEFSYKGYDCYIFRVPGAGHLCGYVKLPIEHKYYGKRNDDIDINVHGGVTFSKLTDKGYLIGFDCAHAGDIVPNLFHSGIEFDVPFEMINTYKTMEFVEEEIKRMVEQLK